MVCVIAKTLQSTHEKSGSVVKPILVYNRLKLICKHLVHGRQEDAHEFMRYLVEAMEKAYLQSIGGTKLDSRSKETNPLGQIFGGYIRTEVTCLKCKNISTTFQHFQASLLLLCPIFKTNTWSTCRIYPWTYSMLQPLMMHYPIISAANGSKEIMPISVKNVDAKSLQPRSSLLNELQTFCAYN